MRILYLSTIFPYPARRGGKLRISNLLSRLSQKHEVHLASLCAEHTDKIEQLRAEAEEVCEGVTIVNHERRRWRGALKSVFGGTPYEVGLFRSRRMKSEVRHLSERFDPDLFWCSRTASLQYLPDEVNVSVLLDQHDFSSQGWEIMAKRHSNFGIRWYAYWNARIMRRYERDKYKKLDICVSVSEKEKEMTRGVAPEGLPILVAPNGVDTDYFAPIKKDEEEGALVSVGSMDQERNIDASEYFVKDILPLLLERGYDVTYYIVGQNPTDRVLALADHPAVTVTGTVEDVRPIIARASIVVAPYRIGGGVKHKIPIAFSMKKPVVSTSNACQGIDVTHEENVLIGDSASQFASLIVQLLSSQEMRQQMGEKARTFIQERYSWNAIAHNLINDVEDIINSARLTQ